MKTKLNMDLSVLKERITKARNEHRTKTALDLAHQLFKADPNPENKEIVFQVFMERGNQLVKEGFEKEAEIVFKSALDWGCPPSQKLELANSLIRVGLSNLALPLIDDPQQKKILEEAGLAREIDAALQLGPQGREKIPENLRPQIDAILKAFECVEKGKDEEAKALLQPIGLQSPFLDWKILIRGLIAYYTKDDAKAIENWQRLNPNRLPARLSLVYRSKIDSSFNSQQTPAFQKWARDQFEENIPFGQALKSVQKCLASLSAQNLEKAFQGFKNHYPAFRQQYPQFAARLSQVFYWAVLDAGDPPHVEMILKLFGPYPDDPLGIRLYAMGCEKNLYIPEAFNNWGVYEESLEKSKIFDPETTRYFRALIWEKRAVYAYREIEEGFAWKEKPSFEECIQKSLELVPERKIPHVLAFDFFSRIKPNQTKSKKWGKELLKRFPDHSFTLEKMGMVLLNKDKFEECIPYLESALQSNPLKNDLRNLLADAYWEMGVKLYFNLPLKKVKGQTWPKDYKELFQKSLQLRTERPVFYLCEWALFEKEAGNESKFQELMNQVQAIPHQRLAVPLFLWLGLTQTFLEFPHLKSDDFLKALEKELTSPPATPQEWLALIPDLKEMLKLRAKPNPHLEKVKKKLLAFSDKTSPDLFTEEQWEVWSEFLGEMHDKNRWKKAIRRGLGQYPKNPIFLIQEIEKQIMEGDYFFPPGAPSPFGEARKLTENLPREKQEKILKRIERLEKEMEGNSFGNPFVFFNRLFNQFNRP